MGYTNTESINKKIENAIYDSRHGNNKSYKKNSVNNAVLKKKYSAVYNIASEAEAVISDRAGQVGLPDSVANLFSLIGMSEDIEVTESGDYIDYVITIHLDGDATRPSLYPAKYPNGTNIIDIFDKGINSNAENPVRGEWHGKRVRGLLHREGLDFISEIINSVYHVLDAQNFGVKSVGYGSITWG